jgi:hypothetical protein
MLHSMPRRNPCRLLHPSCNSRAPSVGPSSVVWSMNSDRLRSLHQWECSKWNGSRALGSRVTTWPYNSWSSRITPKRRHMLWHRHWLRWPQVSCTSEKGKKRLLYFCTCRYKGDRSVIHLCPSFPPRMAIISWSTLSGVAIWGAEGTM